MDVTDVTLAHLAAETDRVVASAAALDDEAVLAPSLCAGWSRGHVLSHLARNAEGIERVCAAALSGEPGTMYDSDESRDAEVASGAGRKAGELADDVRATASRLARTMDGLRPEHASLTVPRTPGGRGVPVGLVPFLRLRELVLHHVDLDVGEGLQHLSPGLVQLLLDDAVARLQQATGDLPSLDVRTDGGNRYLIGDVTVSAGATAREPVVVTGPRTAMVLWLTRSITDDLHSDSPLPTLPHGG